MLAILSDEELGDKITMEQYYYNHMNKAQQAAYHSILSGVKNLADEFQIPALEGEELYNVVSDASGSSGDILGEQL